MNIWSLNVSCRYVFNRYYLCKPAVRDIHTEVDRKNKKLILKRLVTLKYKKHWCCLLIINLPILTSDGIMNNFHKPNYIKKKIIIACFNFELIHHC